MNILAEIRSRFAIALTDFCDTPTDYLSMVKPSTNPQFGDFQANFAMSLAGKQTEKTNALDLAGQIIKKVKLDDICLLPVAVKPGFINLTLRDDWLISLTNDLVTDDRLGVKPVENPSNIVIDYSGPNVAKPMHVGHLRSSVIGDALYKVLSFLGHHVTGDNHIGDWGTQFGMIIYGYKNFLNEAAFEENNVNELARLYRLVNQISDYHSQTKSLPHRTETIDAKQSELSHLEESPDAAKKPNRKKIGKLKTEIGELKKELKSVTENIAQIDNDAELKLLVDAHPNIATDARLETSKLHAGDEENLKLWNQFLPACLDAIDEMYQKLDISFDIAKGESFYQPMLADVVSDLTSKGLATESEGAICVFQEGNKTPFIVRKSDGAYTYATTDLATIQYRVNELDASRMLYVVDARQGGHFDLLFDTAKRWGYEKLNCQHVSFGTILGEDKRPFKTRSGDTVGLESLLDEAITRAREIVNENDDNKPNGAELDDKRRAEIAEIVGIGGIKYADLHHNRESDYVFSWDKMLAKTGDTATYLQYAYARVCGIFRRGNVNRETIRQQPAAIQLTSPAERALILQLNRFADVLDAVESELRPNFLTEYLFETAKCFSTFFDACSVLKAENDEIRTSRLQLCDITARIMMQGLKLLGIEVSENL